MPLLLELLEHPRFVAGDVDTRFLDDEGDALRGRLEAEPPPDVLAVAAAARAGDGASSFIQAW